MERSELKAACVAAFAEIPDLMIAIGVGHRRYWETKHRVAFLIEISSGRHGFGGGLLLEVIGPRLGLVRLGGGKRTQRRAGLPSKAALVGKRNMAGR